MSYLTFLLVFIVPPVAVLALRQPRPLAGVGGLRARAALPLVCLIAFVYTTPWDNYLVYRGVWTYGSTRVLGTVGYVPIEEYLFFLLQPLLTGLYLYRVLGRRKPGVYEEIPRRARVAGAGLYGGAAAGGMLLLALGTPRFLYLSLILAWSAPVLLGMWLYAAPVLWSLRRSCARALVVPTLYLWVVDWFAIRNGIWDIADTFSTGSEPFGLPVEEAVFFLVTNLLVIQGAILFLYGDVLALRTEKRASWPASSLPPT